MVQLLLETLEDKSVPSAVLAGDTLVVTPDGPGKVHTVSIDSVGGIVRVTEDGVSSDFAGVNSVRVYGDQNAANVIQNNTAIDSVLVGGKKDDTIFGGAGRNTIDPGQGKDVVYALLGVNSIDSQDRSADRVFTNAGASVAADDKDAVVRFFAAGRTPGTPHIALESDGVLYITPSNNGSSVVIDEGPKKDSVTVTYDLGDGNGLMTKTFYGVKAISYFGGAGDDTYVNNTKVVEAAYGSAGDDVLVGGVGEFSLLKGSSGDDALVVRAKQSDVSGNGGSDLIVVGGPRVDVIRSDALDTVVGAGDEDVRIGG